MKRKFKIGDKVKLVKKNELCDHGFNVGDICTIDDWNMGYFTYKINNGICTGFTIEECLEPVQPKKPVQSIHIYTDGTTTTAVLKEGKKVIKESKATCHENDEFNFETGVKLAFERLFGDSKEYKEVKREANIGEYIKIINAHPYRHKGYENGDVIRVVEKDFMGNVCGKDTCEIITREYVVLEGYTPKEKEEPTYFTGKVICINSRNSFITEGKIYEFKNGKSISDKGEDLPFIGKVKNVDELNERLYSDFIEVVE